MKLLLDTHIFLWFISGDKRLTDALRDEIRNPDNDVFLSAASVWEACIKYQIGKLPFPAPPETYLPQQRRTHAIQSLPIDEETISYLAHLPPIHRDPFDLILISQALQHNLSLVTIDEDVCKYPVKIFKV